MMQNVELRKVRIPSRALDLWCSDAVRRAVQGMHNFSLAQSYGPCVRYLDETITSPWCSVPVALIAKPNKSSSYLNGLVFV
jgi:hypothetical protein